MKVRGTPSTLLMLRGRGNSAHKLLLGWSVQNAQKNLMEYFQKTGTDNVLEPVLANLKESENSNPSSKDKDDRGKYPGIYIMLTISTVIAVRISNLTYI